MFIGILDVYMLIMRDSDHLKIQKNIINLFLPHDILLFLIEVVFIFKEKSDHDGKSHEKQ